MSNILRTLDAALASCMPNGSSNFGAETCVHRSIFFSHSSVFFNSHGHHYVLYDTCRLARTNKTQSVSEPLLICSKFLELLRYPPSPYGSGRFFPCNPLAHTENPFRNSLILLGYWSIPVISVTTSSDANTYAVQAAQTQHQTIHCPSHFLRCREVWYRSAGPQSERVYDEGVCFEEARKRKSSKQGADEWSRKG